MTVINVQAEMIWLLKSSCFGYSFSILNKRDTELSFNEVLGNISLNFL